MRRNPWSNEEKAAVKRQLNSYMIRQVLPGFKELQKAIDNEPEGLKNRDIITLTGYLANLYRKQKKKKLDPFKKFH